jgi:type II secretory pathway pseudopilin PulG
MKRLSKGGQVWVETVIYTLIGLAVMGLILAMAKPKIDCKKDEIIIEQAKEAMRNINDKIYEVQRAAGNRRAVDLTIGRGKLTVDMDKDAIYWTIDMDCDDPYSEPGLAVPDGILNITTVEGAPWRVILAMDYGVDLQYDNKSVGTKDISEASTTYSIIIDNKGKNSTGDFIIDIREV